MNQHHKLVIAWFIISGLVVFTAVREIQTSVASEAAGRKPLPPPVKTRHAIRPVVQPWSGDPVADYVARCGKGMTDKEIGWVIEDFRNAGLDQLHFTDNATDEELANYLTAQQRWYHATLVDGLRLTREQSAQVVKKLAELHKNPGLGFRETQESGDKNVGGGRRFEIKIPAAWDFGGYEYLSASEMSMAPWNLCQLSASQERLTWRGWFDLLDNTDKKDYETRMEDAGRQFVERKSEPLFLSGDPFCLKTRNQTIPYWIGETNFILPLLAGQKILAKPPARDPFTAPVDDSRVFLLANIRLLHPDQFRLVLLFRPELAGVIQSALESGSR